MKAAPLLLLLLAPAVAAAKPLPRYGTFVYSSLCWGKQSGDASGARLMLVRSRKGARFDYEYGNGGLQGVRIKSVRIEGDRVEAEASTADGDLRLSATLGRTAAAVTETSSYQPPKPRTLKRIRRFSQAIPVCRR